MIVEIFGKPSCPFCDRAKHLVTTKPGIQYKYTDIIEAGIDKEALIRICGKVVSTLPQIFVDGEHIGGYAELIPIIQKFVPPEVEEFDPDAVYYVREIGEGDFRVASFEEYLRANSSPILDTKKEPKVLNTEELGEI